PTYVKMYAYVKMLQCEELDEFVDSTFQMPTVDDPTYPAVQKKVKRARAIIIMRLTAKDHKSTIDNSTQAKDLWIGFKGWAKKLSDAELTAISHNFAALKMVSGEIMHDYITRALDMFNKLSKHSDFVQTVRNGITQIIRGLDDELYATEKVVVTYAQPKDFDELKERLLGIEAERLAKRKGQSEPATALYAGHDGGHKFRGCFTCGGDHLARDCPKKGISSVAPGSGRSSSGSRLPI
ncbi:hypothetical protein VaNZ11_005513, partial [Volvox africanus]